MFGRILLIAMMLPTLALAQGSVDNSLTMNEGTVVHSSVDGDFRIIFPVGCSKVVTRTPEGDPPLVDGMPGVVVTTTFCDRYQEAGEGCSVTSYFNVRGSDDDYPGPKEAVDRVESVLRTLNVKIVREVPVKKILPDSTVIEGLDVYAADPSGVGEAWVRGLLYRGDIYIISAWKSTGDLFDDPDYISTFNSFLPGAE